MLQTSIEELVRASSMKSWSLTGKTRLVKVCSNSAALEIARRSAASGAPKAVNGYVTQEKYLYGKTAPEIGTLLGLRPGELSDGCQILGLMRLPKAHEVEFKLSAAFPNGEVWDEAKIDQMMQARQDFADGKNLYQRSATPVAQYYPPGSAMVPQWRLLAPVPSAGLIGVATRVLPFTRANGSIQPYSPHNRGPVR
ncbi:hypothetical protein [Frigidibacter oleivorans]|uniref:hypothetical protein n=1 Tax=Frigidibacter oleivorans TaxID=2487129 RepID=UPI000F8ED677|nr:hypothetical protein [Frigidibacter oleivorans]